MMTVVVLAAVLMVIGAGIYYIGTGEQKMSRADEQGGQAFYYAEGGIENAINILSYAGTEEQMTQLRADDSSNGYGYLMDPLAADRQDPTDPLVMNIGDESFTVWADLTDENGDHCTGCGLDITSDQPSYVLITAEGTSSEGYRKLQQMVKLEPVDYPLTLFVDGDAQINGTPELNDQSIYVGGDVFGREKITVSGDDLVTGEPAAVFATGRIFAKSNGDRTAIYREDGSESRWWEPAYQYDRDTNGPTGNRFTNDDLAEYPGTSRLSDTQLATLKSMAQSSGYYESASGGFNLQQSDLPSQDGDIVIYVEFPNGDPDDNEINMKFTWPEYGNEGTALVIVENGSVRMTGSAIGNLQGVVYCPDGPVRADGSGNGDFTGFIWGKGMVNIGNFPFNMTEEFMDDPPFFLWTVTREASWTEVDR